MTPKTPNIFDYIEKDKLILPSVNAHHGLQVPEIVMQYSSIKEKFKNDKAIIPTLIKCLHEAKKSYKQIKHTSAGKKMINDIDINALKMYMKSLGILNIGFTVVSQNLIFKEKAILYPNAIVMTMAMKKEAINTAPSTHASKEIFRTYKELGIVVNKITTFLKAKGYNAQAGPAIGGDVNYSMLAEKAGLGAVGKHGLLIGKDNGPSLRIAAVYTDIENLEYTDNKDYLWIKSFCDTCNQCVKKCPSKAIYLDSKVLEDGSKVCIDYKKCAEPFSKDHGCTLCVKNCIFFKGDYNKIKEHNNGTHFTR